MLRFWIITVLLLPKGMLAFNKTQVNIFLTIGTHVNRLGLRINNFQQAKTSAVNTSIAVFYNANSYGGYKQKFGGDANLFTYITSSKSTNNYQAKLANQLYNSKSQSIGYGLKLYVYPKHSTQITGCLALQNNYWQLLVENDALAFNGKDRFRTGALQLNYTKDSSILAIGTNLFSGETKGAPIINGSRGAFKNLSNTKLGTFSNGIVKISFSQKARWMQYGVALGVDAEQIRNTLQNNLIHHSKIMHKINPHVKHYAIAMLQKTGKPCVQLNEQPRPPKLFLLGLINEEGIW